MALKGQVEDNLSRISQDLNGTRAEYEKTMRNLKNSKLIVLDLEKKIEEKDITIKGWESQAYLERRKKNEAKMTLEKEQMILKRVQERFKQQCGHILKSVQCVKKSHNELKAESCSQILLAQEAFKVTLSEVLSMLQTYAR